MSKFDAEISIGKLRVAKLYEESERFTPQQQKVADGIVFLFLSRLEFDTNVAVEIAWRNALSTVQNDLQSSFEDGEMIVSLGIAPQELDEHFRDVTVALSLQGRFEVTPDPKQDFLQPKRERVLRPTSLKPVFSAS